MAGGRRPRGFLPWRSGSRDRSRSRGHRQSGLCGRSRRAQGAAGDTAVGGDCGRHALQHDAADAGVGVADDPRSVRPARRDRGRGVRAYSRARRGDQARLHGARPLRNRPRLRDPRSRGFPGSGVPRRGGRRDRPGPGPCLAAGGIARRYGLARRNRRRRPGGELHPEPLLGVRVGRRAARDRYPVAEPRHKLFARRIGDEPADAGAQALPHPQPRARQAARRSCGGLRQYGR